MPIMSMTGTVPGKKWPQKKDAKPIIARRPFLSSTVSMRLRLAASAGYLRGW